MDLAAPVVQVGKFILCKSTPQGTSGTFEVDVFLTYPVTYLFGPSSEGDYVNSGQCRLVKTVDQAQNPTSISAYENVGIAGTTPGFSLVSVTIITGNGSVTLPGAGTTSNPARCTVTLTTGCVMVFNNAPNSPPPPPANGRMTGGWVALLGDTKITGGLTIHCDITLSNNIEINWPGNKWHLDKPITSATCIDDPAISPQPPDAPFDTFIGKATGELNGVDGSRLEFTFVDSGEPGGKNDKAQLKVFAPNGNVVLDVPLRFINSGNLQAHYDQPHK